jgi:biopolymer transport protein ExbB/TolQ
MIIAILIYRYFTLSSEHKNEELKLDALRRGNIDLHNGFVFCKNKINPDRISEEILNSFKNDYLKDVTAYLTTLSIIASTSPFIGLFGTVVSILESFAKFGTETKVTLNVIAPAISEALIATAAGIFVATFAYSFHQILKRKAFELVTSIESQSDIVVSNKKSKEKSAKLENKPKEQDGN